MPTSFAVERTLGRLGKWLRLMGFDTILETDCSKSGFAECLGGGRIILTRTRRVLRIHAAHKPVFVIANDPSEQLVEVIRKANIRPGDLKPFSRCLRCNEPIVSVPKEAVQGVVPDYVWETHASFSRCLRCSRVYWPGSHTTRSLRKIDRLFEDAEV